MTSIVPNLTELEVWFLTGSQTLYGDEVLAQVAAQSKDVVDLLTASGDIPVTLVTYRFRRLAPEYPKLKNLERWYAAVEQRPAFRQHVLAIPFV